MKENDNGMGFSAFVRNVLREGISGVREAVENVRMKHVSPVGRRGAVNVVGSVACWALTLAGSGAVGAAGAPVVVRVVDPPARSTPTEAVVLAHRILQRESDALLLDAGQRRELAREIDRVLSRIRETYPTMADLTVRQNGFGDGSDIDAVKSQGIWHVAVRRAWGDCPAGCIFQEIFFFTVKGSDVERIARAQAMDMIRFVDLLKNTGWSRWEQEMEITPDDRDVN